MPAATKKRPPLEMEPGEGKAHEKAESKSEELREGAEPDDMPKGKGGTNRKRSAKGAKNTKAPMDGDCGCGGKKGASCDGNCGSYAKKDRNDSLTPQEYLTACELGIQNRSRTYIRARLDATERLDLKCGKGSISEGEKCHVGPAQKVDPRAAAKKEFRTLMNDPMAANRFNKARGSTKGIGNKIKATGELAAQIGGGAAVGFGLMQTFEGAMRGNLGEVSRGYRNAQLGASALQVAAASKASRMGKKELSKEFLKSAGRNAAIGVGQEAAIGAFAGFQRTGGLAGLRRRTRSAYQGARMRTSGMRSTPSGTGWASSAYDRPLNGRRDSVYAAGFSPELDQLAI
jgi:hypothetical protein